jgi:hypothetical protein
MQLEFHQLDVRWEHLRVREPHRQRHLLASLALQKLLLPVHLTARFFARHQGDEY